MLMEFSRRKFLGIRLDAIIETLAFLIIATFIDATIGHGNRFSNVQPHPFWIIVLLISAQYGTLEGIFAVIMSTLFLYIGNLPEREIGESIFDYQARYGLLPFLWLVTSFALGLIHMRLTRNIEKLEEALVQARVEGDTITEAYHNLKRKDEKLEIHLASEQKTAVAIYQTFKMLETLSQTELIFNLDNVVMTALKPNKFSIYEAGEAGFEVAVAHGWNDEDLYLTRYPSGHPLFQAVALHHRMLCVINQKDEIILADQGVLAGPLVDPKTNEIFAMLKIEEIDPMSLNATSIEIFKSLCELISLSYSNAKQFRNIKKLNE